jgi:molybdate transport system ATP-binding protein
MSGLRFSLRVPNDRFTVALDWVTSEPALGIFGPSGAGKSTVLAALAGLRPEARGRIEVAGRTWLDSDRGIALPPERRRVGYVPQDGLLFPHLDVLGNLRLAARRAAGVAGAISPARALALLELEALAGQPVATLSGGERQRVALGRALCSAPDLLLLDEPLASLDRPLRRRLLPFLVRLREELAIPSLYVSHEPSELLLLAGEVTVLDAGRVVAQGRPERVLPGRAGTAEGALTNLLQGRVTAIEEALGRVELAPGCTVAVPAWPTLSVGARLACELDAEDILLATGGVTGLSAQNVLPATVVEVAADDAGQSDPGESAAAGLRPTATRVTAALDDASSLRLVVRVSARAVRELGLEPGRHLQLVFKAASCRVLACF